MTDDRELRAKCLDPGALQEVQTMAERSRRASDFGKLSAMRLSAARMMLGTESEQLAVGQAYGAMEQKVNQLLALNGWIPKSHVCTLLALSRLLKEKELAEMLGTAYHDRQAFDYTWSPGTMRSAESVEAFVSVAEAFIARVQSLVERD